MLREQAEELSFEEMPGRSPQSCTALWKVTGGFRLLCSLVATETVNLTNCLFKECVILCKSNRINKSFEILCS